MLFGKTYDEFWHGLILNLFCENFGIQWNSLKIKRFQRIHGWPPRVTIWWQLNYFVAHQIICCCINALLVLIVSIKPLHTGFVSNLPKIVSSLLKNVFLGFAILFVSSPISTLTINFSPFWFLFLFLFIHYRTLSQL